MEIVENTSIEEYGVELEIVSRIEDVKDDDEREKDELVLEYIFVPDESKLPKKLLLIDFKENYIPSSSTRLEMNNCLVFTKNKNKLFTCTEIGKAN